MPRLIVAAGLSMLSVSAPAEAPGGPSPSMTEAGTAIHDESAARAALTRGRSLLTAGDWRGAARSFEQACRLASPDSMLAFEADTDWHETLPRAVLRALVARGDFEQALRVADDALAATMDHPRHRELLNELRATVVALQKAHTPPVDEKKYSKVAVAALDEFRRGQGRYPAGIPEAREALARGGVLVHYEIVNYRTIGGGYLLELRGKTPAAGRINLRATGLMQ